MKSSKELGVDYIIEGGQTMNPSTEDMLTAIDHVNADYIYILPNNKNIVMAANQARDLTEDKDIIVIPTKTVPQGITAVLNYNAEEDVDTNEETMLEAIKCVKTGQVTMLSVIPTSMIKKSMKVISWELVMQVFLQLASLSMVLQRTCWHSW